MPELVDAHTLPAYTAGLESAADSLDQSQLQLEDTLFDNPFPHLDCLFPLLSSRGTSPSSQELAMRALQLFASHSSGKEMLVGLSEVHGRLLGEIDSFGEGREDGEDEEEKADGGVEDLEAEEEDLSTFVRTLIHLVNLYPIVLLRINTKKPAMFLSQTTDLIGSTIPKLLNLRGSFSVAPSSLERLLGAVHVARAEQRGEDCSAASLILSILKFVDILTSSPWITLDSCKAPLLQVLLQSVSLLPQTRSSLSTPDASAPQTPHSLASHHFYALNPRYRIPGRPTPHLSASLQSIWTAILLAVQRLGLGAETVAALAGNEDAGDEARLFALVLLSRIVFDSIYRPSPSTVICPSSFIPATPHPITTFLETILPSLRNALRPCNSLPEPTAGPPPSSPSDAGLFLLLWVLAQPDCTVSEMDTGLRFSLVEILSTLASLDADAGTRFIAFKLIEMVVIGNPSSIGALDEEEEETQLLLLKGLILDCPFEPMRRSSTALLRQLVSLRLASPSSSLFASPRLLSEFRTLFVSGLKMDRSELGRGEFLREGYKRTLEGLGLLYFLLLRDALNSTGVRSTVTITELLNTFVRPLESVCTVWRAETRAQLGTGYSHNHSHGDSAVIPHEEKTEGPGLEKEERSRLEEQQLELELLDAALERVVEVVQQLGLVV